jgi:hypothetical protein
VVGRLGCLVWKSLWLSSPPISAAGPRSQMRNWSGWPQPPGPGGSRWEAIAVACGVRDYRDLTGVASLAVWEGCDPAAELLFGAAQYALHHLTGSRSYFPALRWDRPACGQTVTDRAAAGRPVHVEDGHAPGCARLAADQAADDQQRRARLAGLIVHSEEPAGRLQRHWLAEPVTEDCPRCGWHGYFHHYIATIGGDWSAAICDDCYVDLHPDITVTVRYYSARSPIDGQPVAATTTTPASGISPTAGRC